MSLIAVAYPRGFLGYDIGIPAETKGGGLESTLASIRFNREVEDTRIVISNKRVETLWKQLDEGDRYVTSFDFREKILLVALHAFGTQSFLDWVLLQESSPYLTDLHKRFLNDTFNFILTGKRSMSVITWKSIIKVRELNSADKSPEIKKNEFFKLNGRLEYRQNHQLVEVINKWLCQEGGFEDLLATLHILFGDVEYSGA